MRLRALPAQCLEYLQAADFGVARHSSDLLVFIEQHFPLFEFVDFNKRIVRVVLIAGLKSTQRVQFAVRIGSRLTTKEIASEKFQLKLE